MKTEAEKKNQREASNPTSEKITLSAADLAKKPIGVRRKSIKTSEKEEEDLMYKGGRVSKNTRSTDSKYKNGRHSKYRDSGSSKYKGGLDSKPTEENKSAEKEFTQLQTSQQRLQVIKGSPNAVDRPRVTILVKNVDPSANNRSKNSLKRTFIATESSNYRFHRVAK